jgi:hypothetical protein
MARRTCLGLVLLGVAFAAAPGQPADPAPFRWEDRWASKVTPITAPVAYADQCLVVSGPDGVAVLAFDPDGEFGVKYRFRCRDLTTKKELAGDGRLYDKPLSADTQTGGEGYHGHRVRRKRKVENRPEGGRSREAETRRWEMPGRGARPPAEFTGRGQRRRGRLPGEYAGIGRRCRGF